VEIIAVTGDAPTRPFARHLRRSHGCRIPAGVGITNVITRIWSGAVRSRERVIRLRAGGGDQSPRKEPAIAKAIVDTTTTGCARERHLPSFRHNPCGSPRLGLFSTSALFQAENDSVTHPFSFSFAALAGTKYGAARRVSKRSRYEIDARAGPASVETSGLSQKDSSPNWSPMMPGTNPLREPQSRVQGRAFRQATSDKGGGLRWHLVPTSAAAPINLVTVNRRYRRGILSLTGHTGCAVTFSVEETVADAIVPDTGSLRFASSTETIGTVVREPMSASELHGALFGVDGPLQDALFTAAEEIAADVDGDRTAFRERLNALRDPDMDASVDGSFVTDLITGLSGGNRFRTRKLVAQMGGNTYLDIRTSFEDIYAGPLTVLRVADVTPTVVVSLSADLFDTDTVRREAREALLEYCTELARACDVRLVATGLVQTRLMQEHRELLPAGVIESAAARLREVAGVVDGDDVVAEALATIDTTDSAWNVLRVICEGRSDSARYAALRSDSRLDFGRSRLSQCLSTLVEADLVFTEGPQNDKYAIATPAGTAALDALASDIGLQTGLGDFENEGVSETLQSKS